MFRYENEPPVECFECCEKANRIDEVKYWVNALLDQLYGIEEFSIENLESYLEELTFRLEMKLPNQRLAVVRKNRTDDILDSWKQFNNQYLNNLAKTGT